MSVFVAVRYPGDRPGPVVVASDTNAIVGDAGEDLGRVPGGRKWIEVYLDRRGILEGDDGIVSETVVERSLACILGFSGNLRAAQILGSYENADRLSDIFYKLDESSAGRLSDLLDLLREGGYDPGPDAEAEYGPLGLELLAVYPDRILRVYDDLSLLEIEEPYAAIGSGAPYALGALDVFHGREPAIALARRVAVVARDRLASVAGNIEVRTYFDEGEDDGSV